MCLEIIFQLCLGLTTDMLIVRSAHEELRRWLTEWNNPDKWVMTMHFLNSLD